MIPRTPDTASTPAGVSPNIPTDPPAVLHALDLARQGMRVLPCKWAGPDAKAPLIRNGLHAASTDPDQIRPWWRSYPRALIGGVIPDHLVVVDIDPQHGASKEKLEHGRGEGLPETLTCWSGRGTSGCHLYFQSPGIELTSVGLPAGVDLLKPGRNYAIMPPSLHPDTGRPYWWEVHPIAPLPPWLLDLLTPKPPPRPPFSPSQSWPRPQKLSPRRLAYWVNRVATAPEGDKENGRNKTLYYIANTARRAGVLDDVADQLADAARSAGLTDAEIAKAITSARNTTDRYTTDWFVK